MPCILYNLNTPKTPVELLHLCRAIKGPVELVDVLDCLYALKKITLTALYNFYAASEVDEASLHKA